MPHDVFISYSSIDNKIANAIVARLEEKGIRCWVAYRDIPAGSNFAKSIVNAINECEILVLIWSANSNSSKHIPNELSQAFDQGITIIPFRIKNVEPSQELSYYIGSTNWLDAITPPMEKRIDDLVKAVLDRSPKIRDRITKKMPEEPAEKKESTLVKNKFTPWLLVIIGTLSVALMVALWSRTSGNQIVDISPILLTPSETISQPMPTETKQAVTQIGKCLLYVYEDYGAESNGYTPAGWVGDIADITFDDNFKLDPKRANVIEIMYQPTGSNQFAGIYWWNPPDSNFGEIDGGFDISCATKLTFWAKGKNGGEKGEFKVGGIQGQFSDSLQPAESSGPIVLTKNWVHYSINLLEKNLTHIIGGFMWVTNKSSNPKGATIYIDDIRFEP
jgi:hypothetical protein